MKTLGNFKKNNGFETLTNAQTKAQQTEKLWTEWDLNVSEDECTVCVQFAHTSSGNRNKKKQTTNTASSSPESASKCNTPDIQGCHTTQTTADSTLPSDMDTQTIDTAPNNEIDDSLEANNSVISPTPMDTTDTQKISDEVNCVRVSQSTTQTTPQRRKPTLVECASSPIFKDDNTPKPLPDIQTPLTDVEEKQNTNFMKRKFAQSKSNIVTCKTGGQPISVMKVTNHRKSSAEISASTKRKRCQDIEKARETMAGPSKQATLEQQSHELNRLPNPVRREVFKTAGLEGTVHIDENHALALKVAVGLTCSQQRELKRVFKENGVTFAHEGAERKVAKDLIGNDVKVTEMLFSSTDDDLVEKPMVMLTDISEKITELLESQKDKLTWHDGAIPENEVWVKVGGDHGQGSLKFNLAIVNTKNPNSMDNNILIGMACVKDSRENMEMFFYSIRKQLADVEKLVWDGKQMKLFLFGDYDFLCKIYGISGACGNYPCLWCLTKKSDIQCKQGQQPERTVTSLSIDHQRFIDFGKGNKKWASCYNNSIHSPMLDIPLDRVTPPYLHCLLGITKRHHTLLEDAADELDHMVFTDDATKTDEVDKFKQYGGNYTVIMKKTAKLNFYTTCLTLTDNNLEKRQWQLKVDKIETNIAPLGRKKLIKRGGPICSTLDSILNKSKITPQAYHGRSFIGNHCNKYFKAGVHKKLTRQLLNATLKHTNNQKIIDIAFVSKRKIDCINIAFSKIHELISTTEPMTDDRIAQIEKKIEEYMTLYRKNFPQKVLPKHHILEHHCTTFIKKHRFGLGLLGEQGGELLHSTIGKIQKRTHAMKDEASQLKTTMQLHLLQTSQQVQSLIPPKRRKKSNKKHC